MSSFCFYFVTKKLKKNLKDLFFFSFLELLQGQWKQISRYYVPSRTPTQVASHAQKHFLRLSGGTKRRSRFTAVEESLLVASSSHSAPCAENTDGSDSIHPYANLSQRRLLERPEEGLEAAGRKTPSMSAVIKNSISENRASNFQEICSQALMCNAAGANQAGHAVLHADMRACPPGIRTGAGNTPCGSLGRSSGADGTVEPWDKSRRRSSEFPSIRSLAWTRTPTGSLVPLLPVLPGRIAAPMMLQQTSSAAMKNSHHSLRCSERISAKNSLGNRTHIDLDVTRHYMLPSGTLRKCSTEYRQNGVQDGSFYGLDIVEKMEMPCTSGGGTTTRNTTPTETLSALDALAGIAAALADKPVNEMQR